MSFRGLTASRGSLAELLTDVNRDVKIFVGGTATVNQIPAGLFEDLEKNLRIYSFLKERFKSKKAKIPKETLKLYNYEEMTRLKKYANETNFIEKATLLGFSPRKSYKLIKKVVSTYDQAIDYVELLFDFDNTLHALITECCKTKTKMRAFYKYIDYLGE